MIRATKIGPYLLYGDDRDAVEENDENTKGIDITGWKILERGVNFERHVYDEIVKLAPGSKGFLDLGCNIGLYAIAVKALDPKVPIIAIDVSATNIQCLLRSISENQLDGITVLNAALADRPRVLQMNHNSVNTTCCADGSWKDGDWSYAFAIPLDLLDLPQIDLVKMDIEGFEYLTLKGATKLMRQRPRFIFEYCLPIAVRSGIEPWELLQFFIDTGYSLTVLDYKPGTRRTFTNAVACHEYIVATTVWLTDILAEPV